MSYNNTQLPVELPIFKDKVMYISSTDSNIRMQQSYVISASYNGILRLSPNSYNTIYENNPIEFTIEEDNAISSNYSDAIVFDDNALVLDETPEQEKLKANADIRFRMIIGSDSDGYLVNFRMSDESVEFDNLGVIGITKTSKLTIYSNDEFSDQNAFVLGNTIMPSLPNTLDGNRTDLIDALKNHSIRKAPEDWDEIQIDIKGTGDQSYLLSGYPNSEGKRIFKYSRSHQFIKDIIKETLLSVQSVPTGSIHWTPVSVEQYKALIDKQQYPNHYFAKNTEGLDDTNTPTDPIIRDYLVCDGRKYPTKEFPELAKILWKEKITYWDSKGNKHTEVNGKKIKTIDKDTQEVKEVYPDYFRVPDLRAKFISYVYAKPALDALYIIPDDIQEYKTNEHNITGNYVPDNSPRYPNGLNKGEHFHFSAYGTYGGTNFIGSKTEPDMYKFAGWQFSTDISPSNFSPRIWYLSNTTGDVRKGESGSQDGNSDPSWGYGFGSAGPRRRWCKTTDFAPVNAYVSAPSGGYTSYKIEPSLGKTSLPKDIYQIPASNAETYKLTEFEKFSDYNELESNISKDNYTSRYGHENAPKFYTFLPLIKI